MEVPEIWLLFGAHVHQDFLIHHPDFFSGFAYLFDGLSSSHKKELHSFLVEVVGANHAPEVIAQIWDASGAEFYMETSYMPEFFSELLRLLEGSMDRGGVPKR